MKERSQIRDQFIGILGVLSPGIDQDRAARPFQKAGSVDPTLMKWATICGSFDSEAAAEA